MFAKIPIVIVTFMVCCSLASAEMYQWVDDNGVVTFKDTPPPPSKRKNKVKVYYDSDFAPSPSTPPPAEKQNAPSTFKQIIQPSPKKAQHANGPVEVYMTSWCGFCKKTMKYLDSMGVSYVTYDIEKDNAARLRHKELGGHGVPLIVIGSHKINGFSPELIDFYLKQ